jgi:predicted DNA-binding transcriptional regulator AlpA
MSDGKQEAAHREAEADALLDDDAACRFLGGTKPIHPTTLYRGVKAGRFSPPIKIGPQTNRWIRRELQADIDRLAAQRRPPREDAA